VAHPAEELHVVTLEGHPGPAAVAEAAAGQRPGEVVAGDDDSGGQPVDRRDEGGAV
jgi:hypothetical protein